MLNGTLASVLSRWEQKCRQ